LRERSSQQLADWPTRAELDWPAGERGDVFLEGVEAEGLQDGGVDVLDGGGPSGILGVRKPGINIEPRRSKRP